MISSLTIFPNCAPTAINAGLQIAPPAVENASQRRHSKETAPAFPKQ